MTQSWPNNVPTPFTSFVGRTVERAQAIEALAGTRLLVLTGAGGTGKTRLALEVANASAASFPDGGWWVDLAPAVEDAHVAAALANVLGVRPLPGRTHTQAAVMDLATGRALVVLDNCEHVAEGAADLCEALLRGCPNVTVVATSRTRLRVPGESDWPVPPLALPSTDTLEEIARSDAGALFVERAARVHFRFVLDGGNAAAVARICRDLDGLPLAIELAAARVRMMSPNQVAEGVRNRFKLLAGGPRGTAARHQTLRASVDWSHDLLTEHQRQLFRRLAVFTGGWSLEAAEAVCAGGPLTSDEVLDLLAALIDDSLVMVDQHPREARYRLLETVREYALELLSASGEETELRERHLDFFLQLSTQARHELETPRVRAWIEALDAETANIDAAIDHAVERRPADALRIGVALTPWWKARAQFGVGQRALSKALAATDASPSVLRARALWSCGYMARFRGDAEAAGEFATQAMEMAEAVGDDWTLAMSLQTVAFLGMMRDPAGSQPVIERAVELAHKDGDPWLLATVLTVAARRCLVLDDREGAERVMSEALPLADTIGVDALSQFGSVLGWCALVRGELEESLALSEQAAAAAIEVDDTIAHALADVLAAWVELLQGRADAALLRMRASESRVIAKGAFLGIPTTRIEVGRALIAVGRLSEAREVLEGIVAGGADRGWTYCRALLALAEAQRALGAFEESRARATEALELSRRVGTRSHSATACELLALLRIAEGGWSEAEALLHDSLAQWIDIGAPLGPPGLFDALAEVAGGLESRLEAARLLGAADRARADFGIVRSPVRATAIAALQRSLRSDSGRRASTGRTRKGLRCQPSRRSGGCAVPAAPASGRRRVGNR